MNSPGTLSVVSTPIGNYSDMTLRAIKLLSEADIVICEEYKEARRLLSFFEIEKELISINEHNRGDELLYEEIINSLLSGRHYALISDCGTPAFADPGIELIKKASELSIEIIFVPGANSVISALVLSGFDISRFYYAGFISPKKDIRKLELRKLTNISRTIVLMETPYRLNKLLEELNEFFPERNIFIGINLTMSNERHLRGYASEILKSLGDEKIKEEFVVVVECDSPSKQVNKGLAAHLEILS